MFELLIVRLKKNYYYIKYSEKCPYRALTLSNKLAWPTCPSAADVWRNAPAPMGCTAVGAAVALSVYIAGCVLFLLIFWCFVALIVFVCLFFLRALMNCVVCSLLLVHLVTISSA